MNRNVPHASSRAAAALLIAAAISLVPSLVRAQTAAPAAAATPATTGNEQEQAAPPVDPSFSAWSLAQQCRNKDNNAHAQCIGAVRGVIHGYQYGVLFLGERASLPANETQRVSLCLRGVPVSSIVDEFVADAAQVSDDSLKRTPAEVAVLGSVHLHHACN
ncbi:hypothetical protein N0A02_09070 [Paraburkholderia acidicola]|uniref:Rap1a immunity protein domain-containing protein n=1 Tax=Paraburkholderia acidicola TaxID=1912599 RepID=A0ABV1LK09_9BURK